VGCNYGIAAFGAIDSVRRHYREFADGLELAAEFIQRLPETMKSDLQRLVGFRSQFLRADAVGHLTLFRQERQDPHEPRIVMWHGGFQPHANEYRNVTQDA